MSEFQNIDAANYDESKVSGTARILATAFNTAANAYLGRNPDVTGTSPEYQVKATIEGAKLIFKDITGKSGLTLSANEQTYLMLTFLELAGKFNNNVSTDYTPSYNRGLSELSNMIFQSAVKKQLIRPPKPVRADML